MSSSREIRLASRPHGRPTADNFTLATTEVSRPELGQLVVRNTVLSVDPYMRGRMNDAPSYVPPFEVGKVMTGGAVGEVVESRDDRFSPGDWVLHDLGWREVAVVDAARATRVDTSDVPPGAYLGVLGMPGLTAYVGLTVIGNLREGDAVFISGAAGAVGSTAGQIARQLGAARVIGSAGSAAKVDHLINELGFDSAFDYHQEPVAQSLAEAAPDGIDVYFDNVGGDHLEAAIGRLRNYGRVAACGSISTYNATQPAPGPRTIGLVTTRRLTIRGFIVSDHADRTNEYLQRARSWLESGQLRIRETVVEGIANAPDAFFGVLGGDNIGKMIVAL
ncbi:MAG: NADP-dependent oxidoreductase [Nocardioidaceae bacterium]